MCWSEYQLLYIYSYFFSPYNCSWGSYSCWSPCRNLETEAQKTLLTYTQSHIQWEAQQELNPHLTDKPKFLTTIPTTSIFFVTMYKAILKIKCSRISQFHEVVPYLLQKHDNTHLEAEVYQAATRMTLKQNKNNNDLAFPRCLEHPHLQIVKQILRPGHTISRWGHLIGEFLGFILGF